jgi:CheY-like chemotaxis protein
MITLTDAYQLAAQYGLRSGYIADMDTPNTFIEELRHTLRHLYDPVFVRKSPLIRLFGLHEARNPVEALRNVLEEGIAALQPDGDGPMTHKSARSYQVLFCRYIQQFSQRDVAHQLDICTRHLRREQSLAIAALADELRTRFGLPAEPDIPLPLDDVKLPNGAASETVDQEMVWLGDSLSDRAADVGEATREAVRLAGKVADRYGVHLEIELAYDLPPLAIAGTVLRQVVLNLVTTAIHSVAAGSTVTLSATRHANGVALHIAARADDTQGPGKPLEREGLEMAGKLVALFQGEMSVSSEAPLAARVTFPSAEQIAVLAIEDNLDTIQLWERYVQGSQFHLVGTREPQRALALAVALKPRVILLDVMMPEVDGWELLGQLRNHPATSGMPVIVCTVLPQEELALSLGARGFLRKPMTRTTFLAALVRQIEVAESVSELPARA